MPDAGDDHRPFESEPPARAGLDGLLLDADGDELILACLRSEES